MRTLITFGTLAALSLSAALMAADHANDVAQSVSDDSAPAVKDVAPPQENKIGDLTGDGVVDTADLLLLLYWWGKCPDFDGIACDPCSVADYNGDRVVDIQDLLALLRGWTQEPQAPTSPGKPISAAEAPANE